MLKPRLLWFEIAAVAVLLTFWLTRTEPGVPLRLTWTAGSSEGSIEPFTTLPSDMPLSLTVELDRPMYVYIASHDLSRGTIAMFPSTVLRSDAPPNPLPAGIHHLPGKLDDLTLQWSGGDGSGPTSFVVIASERPLPELARALLRCRQMGNAAFPKSSPLATYAPAGGMEVVPLRPEPPHPLLKECVLLQDPEHDGPATPLPGHPGIYAKVLRITTDLDTPTEDDEALRARLGEELAPLGGAFQPSPAPQGR